MAILLHSCVVLTCCVVLAVAVLKAPCNNEYTDCDAGECCAITIGAPEGFKGVCQKFKTVEDYCTPEGPVDGECGCVKWMICARSFLEESEDVTYRCQVILPGK